MRWIVLTLLLTGSMLAEEKATSHQIVTGQLDDDQVHFDTQADFERAMREGFFRIQAPKDLNLEVGRQFAKTFTSNPRYTSVGVIDTTNGYLQSEINQTVRFTLERDRWQEHYPEEIQELGHRMHDIGIKVLRSILTHFQIPEEVWFQATGGASHAEGSLFLLFNCYDPALSDKPFGVGAHKDWGNITILDAHQPGLQAKIDGEWRNLPTDDGFLIVNFGYSLEQLLPEANACEHRVVTQKSDMRTSTVVFIDPRVGPFREGVITEEDQGYVYDWNFETKSLHNKKPVTQFFKELSEQLYGVNQTGEPEN